MSHHSQMRAIFPQLEDLPILEFEATGKRYFVLDMHRGKGTVFSPPHAGVGVRRVGTFPCVYLELVQYAYEPTSGMLIVLRPIKTQEEVVKKWVHDEQGRWKLDWALKRWKQVEFQHLEPGELLALEREIPNVVPASRKWAAKRALQFLRDENYVRAAEIMIDMGEPTAPWNPVYLTTPRTQIIVTGKPWNRGEKQHASSSQR